MKKSFIFILSVVIVFAMFSCGGEAGTSETVEKTQSETQRQPPKSEAQQSIFSDTKPEDLVLTKGKTIVQATFKVLSGKLKAAMGKGDIQNAIKVCNIEADPTIDSLSKVFNAKIGRTSLKPRNEKNKPNGIEMKILKHFQTQSESGNELKPMYNAIDEKTMGFFMPIKVKELCLKCHGTVGKEVSKETDKLIKSYYPKDIATGYKLNDLRGIWHIEFPK